MILELIVWLILLSICGGIALVFDYWLQLFRRKDSYDREELIDFVYILQRQFELLTSRGDATLNYLGLVSGLGVAWLLTLFGGLLSPDQTAMSPDHAENQVPNYFFQSILFVGVLHAIWPSMREFAQDRGGPDGFLARLLDTELPFFFALCVTLASISLSLWGVYHEMNFLFCLVNAALCIAYAMYRLRQAREEAPPDEKGGEDYGADEPEY